MNPLEVNMMPELVPKHINQLMHKELINSSRWSIATNNVSINKFQLSNNKTDSGMILCSYEDKDGPINFKDTDNNDPSLQQLNFYAGLVLDLALQRCVQQADIEAWPILSNVNILRNFWNYYHHDSLGTWHTDRDWWINEDGKELQSWSLIYYLNDAEDCGTKIQENGEELLVPQVAGDAVLFPSNFEHAGTSANKNSHRCNLNILFTANVMKSFTKPIVLETSPTVGLVPNTRFEYNPYLIDNFHDPMDESQAVDQGETDATT